MREPARSARRDDVRVVDRGVVVFLFPPRATLIGSAAMRLFTWGMLTGLLVACGPGGRNPGGDDDDDVDAGSNTGGDGGGGRRQLLRGSQAGLRRRLGRHVLEVRSDDEDVHRPRHSSTARATAASPFSMGVDRNATAWVLYADGELFRMVDTDHARPARHDTGARRRPPRFRHGLLDRRRRRHDRQAVHRRRRERSDAATTRRSRRVDTCR